MSDVENNDDLISEDNSYALQLQDLEYMIQLREEELMEMKASVIKFAELQSKLDSQLIAFEHLQNIIGNHQQKEVGFLKREASMEDEMLQSIEAESSFYQLQKKLESNAIEINKQMRELREAVELYHEISDLQKKNTALESALDIANLDNQFLKEELEELRNRQTIQIDNSDEMQDDTASENK
jgi:hypothetical protein